MDPVKRRLVYVADENETLLNELSGTPPTRQSRMTRLLVPLSPPISSPRSSGALSPPPRPVAGEGSSPVVVQKELLVSYNGFLLVDGSGRFSTPHNAAEAAVLRDALKTCRTYLRQFVAGGRSNTSGSTESLSSNATSSTYVEEEEDDDDEDDSPAPPQRRRAKAVTTHVAASGCSPQNMTVAELKEFLRGRGVPAAGNKSNLVLRAQSVLEKEKTALQLDGASAARQSPSPASTSSAHTVRHSGASRSTPASSQLASPTSRTSTESHGLWGALVTAGSRLFGGRARASLDCARKPTIGAYDVPPAKRRRSA